MKYFGKNCTECGRAMSKATRVYKGGRYCATCYKRWFIQKACVVCGKSMRAYRHDEKPVCFSCERIDRRCLRCNRLVPIAGKIVEGRPVCPSCVPHFKKPLPCPECGRHSSYLARDKAAGFDEPVCERCRRKNFKTCSICRKHRKVHCLTGDGKPLCKNCAETEGQSHVCSECGGEAQGLLHHLCESCQILKRVEKRYRLHRERLESTSGKGLLEEFHKWFVGRTLSPSSCRNFDRYIFFFEGIDRKILLKGQLLIQEVLVQEFTAEELRKATTPLNFLFETRDIVVDSELVERETEKRRIADLLVEMENAGFGRLGSEFFDWLQKRESPLAGKTVRVYLRSVLTFLQMAKIKNVHELSQDIVIKVLTRKSGLRASVTPFFNFLKEFYGLHLKSIKIKKSTNFQLEKKLIKSLQRVFERLTRGDIDIRERKALTAFALAKLYGLPLSHVLRIKRDDISHDEMKVLVGSEHVLLENRATAMIERLLSEADVTHGFLFEGRRAGSSLSVTSVTYWVGEF